MAPPTGSKTVAWVDVLDRIRSTLERSLELAAEPAPLPPPSATAAGPLRTLDARLARLQAQVEEAERGAAEADAVLAAEADNLRHWRDAFTAAVARLNDWTGTSAPPAAGP